MPRNSLWVFILCCSARTFLRLCDKKVVVDNKPSLMALCIYIYLHIDQYKERRRRNSRGRKKGHRHTDIYMYIYICLYICVCICTCMYLCMYLHKYIYIYIYLSIYRHECYMYVCNVFFRIYCFGFAAELF